MDAKRQKPENPGDLLPWLHCSPEEKEEAESFDEVLSSNTLKLINKKLLLQMMMMMMG